MDDFYVFNVGHELDLYFKKVPRFEISSWDRPNPIGAGSLYGILREEFHYMYCNYFVESNNENEHALIYWNSYLDCNRFYYMKHIEWICFKSLVGFSKVRTEIEFNWKKEGF